MKCELETKVTVNLPELVVEGPDWPHLLPAGTVQTVTYTVPPEVPHPGTQPGLLGGASTGTLQIDEMEPVAFSVTRSTMGSTYIGSPGHRRHLALHAPKWAWRDGAEKPTEGQAAEIEIMGPTFGGGLPMINVKLRRASAPELKRTLQLQALLEAEEEKDYDTLLAQISKARTHGVEQIHIERCDTILRSLRKQGLHVNQNCDKETLKEMFQWSRITTNETGDDKVFPCSASSTCPCNAHYLPAEILDFIPRAVQDCLVEFGPQSDKTLFEDLVDAALSVSEGSVWKSGGKYIFSAFDRNQSLVALTRMMMNFKKERCAKMLLKLAQYSESRYEGFVTAVQVNFHPNGESYHDQHRDIYSGKQRAGPNCTCSFRECVGTVCFSLGSSREAQMDTMTDELSGIESCGPTCGGYRRRHWLHSGEAMYFNDEWNQRHMHGIPKIDNNPASHGPRISIAFLLGAKTNGT